MERLCFGTYLNILRESRVARISKKTLTDAIIKTVDPNSRYGDKNSNVDRALNHLYKCTGDFSFSYSDIQQLAPNIDWKLVQESFKKDIMKLLNKDKLPTCVYALCHLIHQDRNLHSEQTGEITSQFAGYVGDYKADIESGAFSRFLANVFLFTVNEVQNNAGKEWLSTMGKGKEYEAFFQNYVREFGQKAVFEREHTTIAAGVSDTQTTPCLPESVLPACSPASGAHVHVPDECHRCKYCSKWKGSREAEVAICKAYGEHKDGKDGQSCKYYQPSTARILLLTRSPRFLK